MSEGGTVEDGEVHPSVPESGTAVCEIGGVWGSWAVSVEQVQGEAPALGPGHLFLTANHGGEFFLAGNSLINQWQWGADRQPLLTARASGRLINPTLGWL